MNMFEDQNAIEVSFDDNLQFDENVKRLVFKTNYILGQ